MQSHGDLLVCPETRIALRECSVEEAEEAMCGSSSLEWRKEGLPAAIGPTARVMLREDLGCAYPIVDGVPVLLVPEMLFPKHTAQRFDLGDPMWAEAYEEMEHYNGVCVAEAMRLAAGTPSIIPSDTKQFHSTFPYPTHIWLDAAHDASSQLDCYLNLGDIRGKRIAQLGGKGLHAVKFLLAGAREAWVVTPMHGECIYARQLARSFGVEDQLHCVTAVGEQFPLKSDSLDGIFSGGCLHHMVTESVAREVHRVLRPGGRFSAVDPWQTLLHAVGTRLLGKREENVHCRPMNAARLVPFYDVFEHVSTRQHGPILRYLMIGGCKLLRKNLSADIGYRIGRLEDAVFGHVPALRRRGGSLAVLAAKGRDTEAIASVCSAASPTVVAGRTN